ncbi:MAG TPA: hypothetical protein VGK73_34340 [Polyangiaceae bacterium]
MRHGAATALALVSLSVVPGRLAHAASEEGEKVELRSFACEPAFAAELQRIVRLELGALLHEGPDGDGEHAQLAVHCEPELARVTARDARGTQQAENDLRFDAFPGDAAPRAVALAAVEALRAVDPTLAARIEAQRHAAPGEQTARPQPPRTAEPIPRRPAASVRPGAPRAWTRVLLGAVARYFVADPHTTAWGARAELSRHSASPLDYGFDLEGAFSERSVELGTVGARLVSAGGWLGWRAGQGDWSFTGGAGWRLGVASLEGSSPDPEVQARQSSRIWTGPLALGRGDAAFGPFSLAIALEAGWAVAGAEGLSRGATVIGARGPWLALSLNPGIRF